MKIESVTFEGSFSYVVEQSKNHINYGFSLLKEWSAIDWPFFWRRKYYACLVRASNTVQISMDGKPIGLAHSFEFVAKVTFDPTLEQQLKIAIENEDYEEAARIRDLINGN